MMWFMGWVKYVPKFMNDHGQKYHHHGVDIDFLSEFLGKQQQELKLFSHCGLDTVQLVEKKTLTEWKCKVMQQDGAEKMVEIDPANLKEKPVAEWTIMDFFQFIVWPTGSSFVDGLASEHTCKSPNKGIYVAAAPRAKLKQVLELLVKEHHQAKHVFMDMFEWANFEQANEEMVSMKPRFPKNNNYIFLDPNLVSDMNDFDHMNGKWKILFNGTMFEMNMKDAENSNNNEKKLKLALLFTRYCKNEKRKRNRSPLKRRLGKPRTKANKKLDSKLQDVGHQAMQQRDWELARFFYHEQLTAAGKARVNKTQRIKIAMENLIKAQEMMGDHKQALGTAKRLLQLVNKEKDKLEQHADIQSTIGKLHQNLGDVHSARKSYHLALSINETVRGKSHPETGKIMSSLAETMECPEKQLCLHRQALALKIHCHGTEKHPDVAITLNSIGQSQMQCGSGRGMEDALQSFQKALDIWLELPFEERKPRQDVANTLWRLGEIYVLKSQTSKAIESFGECLAMLSLEQEETRDSKRVGPYLVKVHNGLGILLSQTKQYDESLEHFQEAVHLARIHCTQKPDITAKLLNNVGNLMLRQGAHKRSILFFEEALQMKDKLMNTKEDQISIGLTMHNLGAAYQRNQDIGKARSTFSQSLELKKQVLGQDDPIIAVTMEALEQLKQK